VIHAWDTLILFFFFSSVSLHYLVPTAYDKNTKVIYFT